LNYWEDGYGQQYAPKSMPNTMVTEHSVNSAPSANLSRFVPYLSSGVPPGPTEWAVIETYLPLAC